MFSHPSLTNLPSYESSPRKLPHFTFDQPSQQNISFSRTPSMVFSGANTPRIHPPLLLRSSSRILEPPSLPIPLQRGMSIDIRPNNPLLESLPSYPSTRNSGWNQANMQDPYSNNIPSPPKLHSRHSSLSLNIPTMRPQFIETRSFRSPREQPSYGFSLGFESQMEKQNRMLNQLIGVMAKQEQIEKQRLRMDMNQKIKELELSKLKTEIELERQRALRQQQRLIIDEGLTPRKVESISPKKEPSNLEKVVMSLILKKSSSASRSPSKNALASDRTGSLPLINEKYRGESEEEESQEEIDEKPQRRRVVLSRGNSTTRGSTLNKLQSHQRKSSEVMEQPGSLDYLDESTSSPQRVSLRKTVNNNSKKSVEEEIVASKNASIGESVAEISPTKKKAKRVKIITKSEPPSAILIVNNQQATAKPAIAKEGTAIRKGIFKDLKRHQTLGKLRSLAWLLVYPRILYATRKKHIKDDREAFEINVSSSMGQIYEMSKMFIQDCAGKEILKMLTDSTFNYALANLSESQARKTEKMCIGLVAHLKQIFNKLIVNMNNFPPILPVLLSTLIQDDGFLQSDYFSLFEINRMKFGPFGSLKEMNPQRSKLILAGVFLIRVLIYYFIMRPWEVLKEDKGKFKAEKLLNIGSILYNTMISIFKTSVPAYPNNQSFLSVELKIKPKKNLLQAIDGPEPENAQKADKNNDVIQGFYSVQQQAAFFEFNKKKAEELKQSFTGYLDALYEKVAAEQK